MTTFTMRRVGGDFVVTSPDVEPKKFKTRREAREWCTVHYPGSPIREIVPLRKRPTGGERQAAADEQGRQGDSCATMPASAGRMTPPYNRLFLRYGSGIDAGTTTIPKGTAAA
jgi:hypothetical protein